MTKRTLNRMAVKEFIWAYRHAPASVYFIVVFDGVILPLELVHEIARIVAAYPDNDTVTVSLNGSTLRVEVGNAAHEYQLDMAVVGC